MKAEELQQSIVELTGVGFKFNDTKSMIRLIKRYGQSLIDEAAKAARDFALNYPTDVFAQPPAGQHGETVDACSAAAIRAMAPIIALKIEEMKP